MCGVHFRLFSRFFRPSLSSSRHDCQLPLVSQTRLSLSIVFQFRPLASQLDHFLRHGDIGGDADSEEGGREDGLRWEVVDQLDGHSRPK